MSQTGRFTANTAARGNRAGFRATDMSEPTAVQVPARVSRSTTSLTRACLVHEGLRIRSLGPSAKRLDRSVVEHALHEYQIEPSPELRANLFELTNALETQALVQSQ
jgi:hypothetical protein